MWGAGGIGLATLVAVIALVLWGGGGAGGSAVVTATPGTLSAGGTPSNGASPPGVFGSGPAASGSTGSSSNTPAAPAAGPYPELLPAPPGGTVGEPGQDDPPRVRIFSTPLGASWQATLDFYRRALPPLGYELQMRTSRDMTSEGPIGETWAVHRIGAKTLSGGILSVKQDADGFVVVKATP